MKFLMRSIAPLILVLVLLLPCLLVPASAVYVDDNSNAVYSLDEVAASITETATTIEVSIDPDVMDLATDFSLNYYDCHFYLCSLFGGAFEVLSQNGAYELLPDGGSYFVDVSSFPASTSMSITVWLYDANGAIIPSYTHLFYTYLRYVNDISSSDAVHPYDGGGEGFPNPYFNGSWTIDIPISNDFSYANYMFLLEADTYEVIRPYVEAKIVFQKADIGSDSEIAALLQQILDKLNQIEQENLTWYERIWKSITDGFESVLSRLDALIGGSGDGGDILEEEIFDNMQNAADNVGSAVGGTNEVISSGSNVASGIVTGEGMAATITTLGSCMSIFFTGNEITLCGVTFNPWDTAVAVFGGLGLISLMLAYVFRKRGGG